MGGLNLNVFCRNDASRVVDAVGLSPCSELPQVDYDPPPLYKPGGGIVPLPGGSYVVWPIPVPGAPSRSGIPVGHLVRTGGCTIDRCSIAVLAGHGSSMPAVMRVAKGAEGCAYGAAYGCNTGGGQDAFDPDPSHVTPQPIWVILIPPVISPGIPGAPPQPTSSSFDLAGKVESAFIASIDAAKGICKKCCCPEVSVYVRCRNKPEDLVALPETSSGYSDDLVKMQSMCSLRVVVKCAR